MSFSDIIYHRFENLIKPLDTLPFSMRAKSPLALLLDISGKFRGTLLALSLLAIAVEVINLLLIWGMSFVVDGVVAKGATEFLRQDWVVLAVLAALNFPVLPVLYFIWNAIASQAVGVCMPAAVQWQGHKAVERQDLAFFQELLAGQIAARISQVAFSVQQQIAASFQSIPQFIVQFVGSLVLLGALSWPLSIPVAVWIVCNVVLTLVSVPHFSERSRRSARERSLVVGAMTDLYANILTVKLFGAENDEADNLRSFLEKSISTQQHERRVFLTTGICLVTLNVLLSFSVMAIGFWGAAEGFVTTGELVASFYIVQRLSGNARSFLQMGQQIFQALGTIRDAMPIMTRSSTVVDQPSPLPLLVTGGEIQFENVSFEYRPGNRVFNKLSFKIRPSEKVGIVGLSGAGKSTLINILLRFFDPVEGSIMIDGQDIRMVRQVDLRQNIGVITQDAALLHRSIGENIGYGKPGASRSELERAASLAEAGGFILGIEDTEGRVGYEAFVGDRAVKLSGGQRQRIAIARVLLKDAPILVLDEATSALDSEAEAAIQEKLDVLMEQKTVIAIAHRLSTIARMDRIIVIGNGGIIEEGTHNDLLRGNGLYAQLWRRQNGAHTSTDR
ncbi:ABC transporter ATP-binding protein [Rhizobium laguerreae]|uniref:ABC transporter ATP-binding protein n=1 Tax=Rhizobium laguerreae TaxID=1076926 RepID=UPI001C915A2C|nr:ABC transporter ATP-binding protein [Rhizobium laguerreae]MBY3425242.1 ABC transporter ATP-binding protein [Rhizobium laguerreae]